MLAIELMAGQGLELGWGSGHRSAHNTHAWCLLQCAAAIFGAACARQVAKRQVIHQPQHFAACKMADMWCAVVASCAPSFNRGVASWTVRVDGVKSCCSVAVRSQVSGLWTGSSPRTVGVDGTKLCCSVCLRMRPRLQGQ
jgi:hypothetical protein